MTQIQIAVFAGFLFTLCVSMAGVLCYQGKNGWGWFVLLAFLVLASLKLGDNAERKPSVSVVIEKGDGK